MALARHVLMGKICALSVYSPHTTCGIMSQVRRKSFACPLIRKPVGYASMSIRFVRLGSERAPQEGLRIGTVRRPPRGVPKSEFASRNFYDVWLPNLAPSEALVKKALS